MVVFVLVLITDTISKGMINLPNIGLLFNIIWIRVGLLSFFYFFVNNLILLLLKVGFCFEGVLEDIVGDCLGVGGRVSLWGVVRVLGVKYE